MVMNKGKRDRMNILGLATRLDCDSICISYSTSTVLDGHGSKHKYKKRSIQCPTSIWKGIKMLTWKSLLGYPQSKLDSYQKWNPNF